MTVTVPIRVALVDDQHLVRAGLRMVVDSQPDLTVVVEAGDGREALDRLALTPVDVVLMDVRMPRLDGVAATRELLARPGAPRVVVLTTFDLDEYLLPAIEAGASGFLLKDAPPEDLLAAVRSVHNGDAVVVAAPTRRLLDHVAAGLASARPDAAAERRAEALSRTADLTPRERDVLGLMAEGLSNTEIARRLVLGETTVKSHVGRVLAKTGSRDRVQAVVLAHRAGLTGT
ncbi:MAG: response regulator [Actinomycetales bacterium]